MNSSRISPTTAYYNDSLLGHCNATDSDGDNVSYEWNWYLESSKHTSSNKTWVQNNSLIEGFNYTYYPIDDTYPALVKNLTGDDRWVMISGREDGTFASWDWNGSGWERNDSLRAGLGDTGSSLSTPSAAYDLREDNKWVLISGQYDGTFDGYYWNDSEWIPDNSTIVGLTDLGANSKIDIVHNFTGNERWTALIGEFHSGITSYFSYEWNGSEWISNSSLVAGLDSTGAYFPSVELEYNMRDNNKWILIIGSDDYYSSEMWYGFEWNGTSWISDNSAIDGLNDAFISVPGSEIVYNFTGNDKWSIFVGNYKIQEPFLSYHLEPDSAYHQSGFEVNIANISSSHVNKGDNWTLECRAYDGSTYSSWLNSSTIQIQNYLPTFYQSYFISQHQHHLNVSIQINASDIEGDTLTYAINDSRFDINSSSGILNKTTSSSDVGEYNVTINISDSYNTMSMWIIINISNSRPSLASVIISPSPADSLDNLTCLNNSLASDANGDAVTFLYRWLKEGIDQGILTSELGAGNTSTGDNWSCTITPYDSVENGTKVLSQTVQIGQSEVAPIIISTNATTNGLNISNSTQPTELADNVSLSVSISDLNDNTFAAYFCKSNSANSSGCTGETWCNTTYSNATSKSCSFNVSVLTLDTTYTYYAFVVDNTSLVSASYSNTFYVGDVTSPVLSDDSLSSSSGINNAQFTIYVNASDENNITLVLVEITDPNSARFNYSMSGSGNGLYTKTYAPSTDGTYTFRFFAKDQSSNEGSLVSTLTYTDSTYLPPAGGGGGGGSTIINLIGTSKAVCNVSVTPASVKFSPENSLVEIILKNKDPISYDPTLKLTDIKGNLTEYIEITNYIPVLLPTKQDSFGLRYKQDKPIVKGYAVLTLQSSNCKDINITVMTSQGLVAVSIFADLISSDIDLIEFMQENIFSPGSSLRDKLPYLTMGAVTFVIFAIFSVTLHRRIFNSFIQKQYIRTLIWGVFIVAVTAVSLVFLGTGLRMIP